MILLKVVLRLYFERCCREHWISLDSFTKDSSQAFTNSTLAAKKIASYPFAALLASMLKTGKTLWESEVFDLQEWEWIEEGILAPSLCGENPKCIPHTPQPSFRRQSCGASEESEREVVWVVFHLWNPACPWSMWTQKANKLVLREEGSPLTKKATLNILLGELLPVNLNQEKC